MAGLLQRFIALVLGQSADARARALRILAAFIVVAAALRRATNSGKRVVTSTAAAAAIVPAPQPATASGVSAPLSKIASWRPFSEFLAEVDRGGVAKVVFGQDDVLEYAIAGAEPGTELLRTRRVPSHLMPLVGRLADKTVSFEQASPSMPVPRSSAASLLVVALPVAYVGFLGWVLYRFMGPGAEFGGSNAVGDRAGSETMSRTSFAQVAGADEARAAVREVCDVLKNPEKYERVGARLPRGLLLVGPPGTGKTMLARAMAAEAGIPFFYCAGSDFVEVFAGRGAARVRSLFQRASKASPAVVFIDEIDALGGTRHSGGLSMGNNEEREQTLNQLLSCMDGFDSDRRIVVMGATNRFEALDPALVRPGRFDRVVRVELPNERGRAEILKVHTRDMQLGPDVDLTRVATACRGMTGAELASLANEAAIRAVRAGRETLVEEDFRGAIKAFAHSRRRGASTQGRRGGIGGSDLAGRIASLFGDGGAPFSQRFSSSQDDDADAPEELD